MLKAFLISVLCTISLTVIIFPFHMTLLLNCFEEEAVDMIFLKDTGILWIVIFIITIIVVKREKDSDD